MASIPKPSETMSFVQSPLVTASNQDAEDKESDEIDVNLIRKLENWQHQAVNAKAGLIQQFTEVNLEIKRTLGATKKIEAGIDAHDDSVEVSAWK